MKIIKGFTKKVDGERKQFVSEAKYKRLTKLYDRKCSKKTIVEDTDSFYTVIYRFAEQKNIVRLGWAYYPQF